MNERAVVMRNGIRDYAGVRRALDDLSMDRGAVQGRGFRSARVLPQRMEKIAPVLPAYHQGGLARTVRGVAPHSKVSVHAAALAALTPISLVIAAAAWRRAADRI